MLFLKLYLKVLLNVTLLIGFIAAALYSIVFLIIKWPPLFVIFAIMGIAAVITVSELDPKK